MWGLAERVWGLAERVWGLAERVWGSEACAKRGSRAAPDTIPYDLQG